MKVIDILNKIANGEEVPKKIIGKNSIGEKEEYIYNDFWYIHIFENPDGEEDYYYMSRDIRNLNEEVEIIEDKKIEKVNTYVLCDSDFSSKGEYSLKSTEIIDKAFEEYSHRINEIIEVINGRD